MQHVAQRYLIAILIAGAFASFGTVRADDAAQEPLMHETGSEQWPTILVDGVTRRYIFNVPDKVKAAGKPAPMFVFLHGAGQGADRLRSSTTTDQVSEQEGFIAVYPQGLNASWNDSRPAETIKRKVRSSADDKAFLRALVERFVKEGLADPARVYLAGVSNGGFLAVDVACSASHPFAAIGSAIAGAVASQFEKCSTQSFVPFVLINGTKDTFVPWEGSGEGKARMLATLELFERVATQGGCTTRSEQALPDRYASDGVTTTLITAGKCKNDGEVALYRLNEGGHQLPSHRTTTNERLRAAMFGLRSIDIDATAVLWEFFKRFKKSGITP